MAAEPRTVPKIVSAKRHTVDHCRVEVKFDRIVSPQEVRDLLADLVELRRSRL